MKVADLGAVGDLGKSPGLGIFNTDVVPGHGLIGQVYVPGTPITKMPVFERLTPVYTFLTANLDVPTRNYNSGFPTPEKQTVVENFAIRFRGKLAVGKPGTYIFELYSDDGAKLYINKKLVINNDGVHPAQSRRGKFALQAGMPPCRNSLFPGAPVPNCIAMVLQTAKRSYADCAISRYFSPWCRQLRRLQRPN